MYKMDFCFSLTEKVIDSIIVELNEVMLLSATYFDRKPGLKCTNLVSNCHMLMNPAKVIFGYGNPFIFL